MAAASDHTLNELRDYLREVVESCPLEQCNPEDCLLYELRALPRTDRLRWLNALGEADLKYLAAYHHVCMKVRIASRLSRSAPLS